MDLDLIKINVAIRDERPVLAKQTESDPLGSGRIPFVGGALSVKDARQDRILEPCGIGIWRFTSVLVALAGIRIPKRLEPSPLTIDASLASDARFTGKVINPCLKPTIASCKLLTVFAVNGPESAASKSLLSGRAMVFSLSILGHDRVNRKQRIATELSVACRAERKPVFV